MHHDCSPRVFVYPKEIHAAVTQGKKAHERRESEKKKKASRHMKESI
jgi:tmRNA-binding protein